MDNTRLYLDSLQERLARLNLEQRLHRAEMQLNAVDIRIAQVELGNALVCASFLKGIPMNKVGKAQPVVSKDVNACEGK